MDTGTRRSARHAIAVAAAFAVLALGAQVAAAGQDLNLRMGFGTIYDTNLLEYSKDQRALFERGTRPDWFSIRSLDDVTWNPVVALIWDADAGRGRHHSLRLKGEGDFHARNPTADFRSISAGWREAWSGGRRLSFGYYALPHYYLRQLAEEDSVPPASPGHVRAQFDLQMATASWGQRIAKRTGIELAYQFENRRYVPEFRERDSKTHQGELTLEFTGLPNRGSIDVSGGWRDSKAKGTDGDEIAGSPPDDADLTYHGPIASLAGRVELGRTRRSRVYGDARYEYGSRSYDSDRPADRFHFGRSDALNAVELGLRLQLRPHWNARGFFRHESDLARLGANAPATSDVGSYSKNQLGLVVDWSGSIWRSERGSGAEPDTID
jgi:hypothetical protein